MNEETRYDKFEESLHSTPDNDNNYNEETAAELATPVTYTREYGKDEDREDTDAGGKAIGWAALALGVLSLFFLPVILGAAAIVLGFVARRKGSESLGAWSIGIGAVSIIIGLFILPFF